MKRLPDSLILTGIGFKNMTATCLKRTDHVCMYERGDDVLEVFRPNIIKKGTVIFDKTYDEDIEMYPINEDFGKIAYCYSDKEKAEKRYDNMIKNLL